MDTKVGLQELFEKHHSTILQAAYQITGNLAESEDVLQTIFLRLLRREASELGKIGPGYLRRAAINAALDIVRARKTCRVVNLNLVHGNLSAESAGPDRLYSAQELRRWLREAISRLNPAAAEIFVLRYFHDMGNGEIADLLGTSPGTVAVTLHRTRIRLQNEIKSHGDES
jgi:RNA polymerase sigma-70 factor (ECF subfamily)